MDTDINDIWDLPVETSVPRPPVHTLNSEGPTSPPHASTRSRPLFLPSDDEQDAPATATKNPDIDALFEGLEDMDDGFQDLAPALDLDALRREADARNTRAVRAEIGAHIPAVAELSAAAKPNGGKGGPLALDGLDGDGEDGGKKKRKPVPRLDEARLLGKNGFPQLIEDMKNFKPKGKGHEVDFFTSSLPRPTLGRYVDLTQRPRQRTWIAYSKCTNSGPTNYILKLDSKRQ